MSIYEGQLKTQLFHGDNDNDNDDDDDDNEDDDDDDNDNDDDYDDDDNDDDDNEWHFYAVLGAYSGVKRLGESTGVGNHVSATENEG